MNVRDKDIYQHIIQHSKRIKDNISGRTFFEFSKDQNLIDIICFNEMQIGELAKKLSEEAKSIFPSIPWKNICGMWDKIAHGYGSIDLKIAYSTATIGIETLLKTIKID